MAIPGGDEDTREALGREAVQGVPSDVIAQLRDRFPRVAITHEWLTVPGGSELVLMQLLELLPHAEIFTSVYDPEPWPEVITSRPVHTSFLDRIPRANAHYPKLLPFMNAAFESFDLRGFDLVISSNHACAKNVLTGADQLHVCYCHTPMRYAWEPGFFDQEALGPLSRVLLPPFLSRLRRQDLAASARPDGYLANSSHVAARIKKYYRRGSRVVHPPVEIDRFLETERGDDGYYLVFGRVVPYKRVDQAVAACALLDLPLKVAGGGRGLEPIRRLAGRRTEFLGHVPDEEVPALMAGARALLFPGEEDFGIVPVEAQAAGTPVIAYGVGGARDSVRDGETGLLYRPQTVDGLCTAIKEFESRRWDTAAIRANARAFTPARFHAEVAANVLDLADRKARIA